MTIDDMGNMLNAMASPMESIGLKAMDGLDPVCLGVLVPEGKEMDLSSLRFKVDPDCILGLEDLTGAMMKGSADAMMLFRTQPVVIRVASGS
jgi:hypothetical protein